MCEQKINTAVIHHFSGGILLHAQSLPLLEAGLEILDLFLSSSKTLALLTDCNMLSHMEF